MLRPPLVAAYTVLPTANTPLTVLLPSPLAAVVLVKSKLDAFAGVAITMPTNATTRENESTRAPLVVDT
jgi:hypothetical protein